MSWLPREDIAGLDIGDRLISAARVARTMDGRVVVTHAGWREYDPAGSARQTASAIRSLWRSVGMPTQTVCSTLRSKSVIMRHFKMPDMPPEELTSALQLQAEEAVQIPANDLVVEWQVSPVQKGTDQPGTMEGVFAAVPVRDVEQQLDLIKLAGLLPVIVDIPSMALANAYLCLRGEEANGYATLLVNMTSNEADLAILVPPGWIYPYTVYSRGSSWAESTTFLCESMRDLVRFSGFKLKQAPVRKVLLTGQVTAAESITATVGDEMGIPVEVWNPLQDAAKQSRRVRKQFRADQDKGGFMTTSIGLALRRI